MTIIHGVCNCKLEEVWVWIKFLHFSVIAKCWAFLAVARAHNNWKEVPLDSVTNQNVPLWNAWKLASTAHCGASADWNFNWTWGGCWWFLPFHLCATLSYWVHFLIEILKILVPEETEFLNSTRDACCHQTRPFTVQAPEDIPQACQFSDLDHPTTPPTSPHHPLLLLGDASLVTALCGLSPGGRGAARFRPWIRTNKDSINLFHPFSMLFHQSQARHHGGKVLQSEVGICKGSWQQAKDQDGSPSIVGSRSHSFDPSPTSSILILVQSVRLLILIVVAVAVPSVLWVDKKNYGRYHNKRGGRITAG